MREGPTGTYSYFAAKPTEDAAEVAKEIYKGAWKNNQKHGIGKQNYINIGEYYGNWEFGDKCGEGVMMYVNGDIYSGLWKNGKKDG